jgi:ankyrin repeat protein
MRAAAGGHADVVQVLLEAGTNARIRDEGGATAAELARQLGHAEALASLESHASRRGGLF